MILFFVEVCHIIHISYKKQFLAVKVSFSCQFLAELENEYFWGHFGWFKVIIWEVLGWKKHVNNIYHFLLWYKHNNKNIFSRWLHKIYDILFKIHLWYFQFLTNSSFKTQGFFVVLNLPWFLSGKVSLFLIYIVLSFVTCITCLYPLGGFDDFEDLCFTFVCLMSNTVPSNKCLLNWKEFLRE